jgi:hydrogenase expression/formation protein HypE
MAEDLKPGFALQCPVTPLDRDRIVLAHGGGGRMTERLVEQVFLPVFDSEGLRQRHDGAVLALPGSRVAMTTDAYVVRPLFFPGGSIGDLAVNGTVNDLAMCAARPLWLTAAFVLEEGLPVETLRRVVADMGCAARAAGVALVAGDTKVVEKGKADGLYVTTAGAGVVEHGEVGPFRVEPGDAIIVSGDLGAHGIAVLSVREGLEFEAPVESDTAPLWAPVEALLSAGLSLHCLRDLTRGGLSSTLNEIAKARGAGMVIEETAVPVREVVRGACELLGLDPFYVANEGRFCAFLPAAEAEQAVEILRHFDVSRDAVIVGQVMEGRAEVVVRSRIGSHRVLDMLSGEQLPRIC